MKGELVYEARSGVRWESHGTDGNCRVRKGPSRSLACYRRLRMPLIDLSLPPLRSIRTYS